MLVLVFLVVPLVELWVIVQVARSVGIGSTIGLLILVSVVGAWLLRTQGLGVLGRVQSQLAQGRMPGRELLDGLLVVVGGALMLTPGFVTDGIGLALLVPPTRALVRTLLVRHWRNRVTVVTGFTVTGGGTPGPRAGTGGTGVIDVDVVDADSADPDEDGPGGGAGGAGGGA